MIDNLPLETVDYGTRWAPAASIRPIGHRRPIECGGTSDLLRYSTKNRQKKAGIRVNPTTSEHRFFRLRDSPAARCIVPIGCLKKAQKTQKSKCIRPHPRPKIADNRSTFRRWPTHRIRSGDFHDANHRSNFPLTNGIGGEGQGRVAVILTLHANKNHQKSPVSKFYQVLPSSTGFPTQFISRCTRQDRSKRQKTGIASAGSGCGATQPQRATHSQNFVPPAISLASPTATRSQSPMAALIKPKTAKTCPISKWNLSQVKPIRTKRKNFPDAWQTRYRLLPSPGGRPTVANPFKNAKIQVDPTPSKTLFFPKS